MRTRRRLAGRRILGLLVVIFCLSASDVYAANNSEKKMDAAIQSGDLSKTTVKNWMNPSITIGDASITLSWNAKTRQTTDVSLAILENVLIDLPKDAWPYGRIVRIAENGVSKGSSETKRFRAQSRSEIAKILKKLDVLTDLMPSG